MALPAMQAMIEEQSPRFVHWTAAAAVIALALVWLIAVAAAAGAYLWEIETASFECPAGQEVVINGWADGVTCSGPGAGEGGGATKGPVDPFEPSLPAAVAAVVVLGGAALVTGLIRTLTGSSWTGAALGPLVLLASIIAGVAGLVTSISG
jgi:hypothetical protein